MTGGSMTQNNSKAIDSVKFDAAGPTELSFTALYTWVIWQFPRQQKSGLCGAVHPPIPDYGWLPAIIYPQKKQLAIYAHLDETFATPEEAADYLYDKK
jgi:hypothetical protein